MSLTSLIGAASSAVHQAIDVAEAAARSAAQPLLDAARDAVLPVVADGLAPIAEHPEWFGPEVSGVARLFAELCLSEPTGSPVVLPRPLQDTVQTAR